MIALVLETILQRYDSATKNIGPRFQLGELIRTLKSGETGNIARLTEKGFVR